MTQRLHILIKPTVALLLLSGSLPFCANSLRAEIRLHAATGMQFSLAFRPSGNAHTAPCSSLQPPDAEEGSIGSLHTVESSLQRHQARLALLSPRPTSRPVLIVDGTARDSDHDTQTLPLATAAWNFPQACIDLVSGEQPPPQQLAERSLVLTANYAATAFAGTCTVWDLTSSPGQDNAAVVTSGEQRTVAVRPSITIPTPAIVAYRDTPIHTAVSRMQPAGDQITASARDSQPVEADLPEPVRGGDSVRPWVLGPNVAAKFRGNGFQLISNETVPQPRSATPAFRRPTLRTSGAGFRAP